MKITNKLNDQAGFSHVELFIVVVVLAVIGFAGFHVYQSGQNKDNDSAVTSSQAADDELTPPPADTDVKGSETAVDSQASAAATNPDATEAAQ